MPTPFEEIMKLFKLIAFIGLSLIVAALSSFYLEKECNVANVVSVSLFHAVFFLLIITFLKSSSEKFCCKVIGLGVVNSTDVILFILLALALQIASIGLNYILIWRQELNIDAIRNFYISTRADEVAGLAQGWRNIILVNVLAAIVEEYVFRVVLFDACREKFNFITAAFVTSIVFWACHLSLSVSHFSISMLLCLVIYRTRSYLLCVVAHFCSNVIIYVIFFQEYNVNYIVWLNYVIIFSSIAGLLSLPYLFARQFVLFKAEKSL